MSSDSHRWVCSVCALLLLGILAVGSTDSSKTPQPASPARSTPPVLDTPRARPASTPVQAASEIMGSPKAQVDALLSGWSSRESRRSTASKRMYYYTSDVDMIVTFRGDRAVGVAVVDRPGAGVTSISDGRFRELVRMIGQSPASADIKRDESGIHEFYVGDT